MTTKNLVTVATSEVEPTNMDKVKYLMQRPGLLMEMLPKEQREALQGHVGRRTVNRGLANPRLNKR